MYYSGLQNKKDLISVKSSGINMPIGLVQWIVRVKGTGIKWLNVGHKSSNQSFLDETNFAF